MKKITLILTLLIGLANVIVAQKIIKNISKNDQQYFFKALSGYQFGCDVTMGYATGKGNIYFNQNQDLAFRIFVLGRKDYNKGFLNNLKIQTEDFKKYYFFLDWKNYVKNNGTLEANIEIQYNIEDQEDRIDFWFIGESNWQIYTRTKIEKEERAILNNIIRKYFLNTEEYKSIVEQRNKSIIQQQIRDSIQKATDSIQRASLLNSKRINDSINNERKTRQEDSIRKLKVISDSLEFVRTQKMMNELTIGSVYFDGIVVKIYDSNGVKHGLLMHPVEDFLRMEQVVKKYQVIKDGWRIPIVSEMQLIIKLAKKDDAFNSFLEKSEYKGETYGWGSANWWYALPELNLNPTIDNLWYVFKSKLGKDQQIKNKYNSLKVETLYSRLRLVKEF